MLLTFPVTLWTCRPADIIASALYVHLSTLRKKNLSQILGGACKIFSIWSSIKIIVPYKAKVQVGF